MALAGGPFPSIEVGRSPLSKPQRIYDAADTIDRLRAVKTAQRLGFTLLEIEEILRLATGETGGDNPLQQRMREKVLEIDARIEDLYAIRQRLAEALHAGCDSLTDCTCPACPLLVLPATEERPHGRC